MLLRFSYICQQLQQHVISTFINYIGWDLANISLFKINCINTRKRYEIRPKLTINTIESRFGVFTVNCEVFLLLALNR